MIMCITMSLGWFVAPLLDPPGFCGRHAVLFLRLSFWPRTYHPCSPLCLLSSEFLCLVCSISVELFQIVRDLAEHLWAFLEEKYFPGSHASSSSSRKKATSSEPGGCSEEGLPGMRTSKIGEETGGGGPSLERPGEDSDSSVSTSHVTVPSRSHRVKRKKSAGGTYQSRHTGVSKGDEEGNASSSATSSSSSTGAGITIHPPCTRRKASCREEKRDTTTAASVPTFSGSFSPSRLRRTRQRVEREAVRFDGTLHSSRNSPGTSGGGVCEKGDPPSQRPSSSSCSSSSSSSVSSASSSSSSASHLLSSPSPSSSGRVPPPTFHQNSHSFSPPRYHTRDYSPPSPSSISLPVASSSALIGDSFGGGDLGQNHTGVPRVLPFPSPSLPLQEENASDRPFSTDSSSPRNHHVQSHVHDISTSSSFTCSSSSSPSAVCLDSKLRCSPPSPALEKKRNGGSVPTQQSLSDQQRLLLVKLLEQLGIANSRSPLNRSEGEGETSEPYISNRGMVCNQDFRSSPNREDSNTSLFIGNQQEQRHSFVREGDSTSNRLSPQNLLLSLQQKQEQRQQERSGTTSFQQDYLSRRLLPSLPSVGRELLKLLQATRDQRERQRVVKGEDEERFESMNSQQKVDLNRRNQDGRYSPYPRGIVEGDTSSFPTPNSSLVGPLSSSLSMEGDRRDLFVERNHQNALPFDLPQLQRAMQQAFTTNAKREGREGEGGRRPAATGDGRYFMGDANSSSRSIEREGREDQKLFMSSDGKGKAEEIMMEEGEEVSRPVGLSSLLQFVRQHASSSSGSS